MVKLTAKWLNEKFDNCLKSDKPSSFVAAFAIGAVEGFLDVALVVGVVIVGAGLLKSIVKK
jgi:hypothetical protein